MNEKELEFGFLTLATMNDYLKAIGLALSIRVSNPGVPIAIACSNKVRPLVEPYFDYMIEEKAGIKGFIHKVYLDIYSPFENTVFFDSDVLVFKPVKPFVQAWSDRAYNAVGMYCNDGKSAFDLDRAAMLKKIGKENFVEIGGAGHAIYFKPKCIEIFDYARKVSENYKEYSGGARYADEDAMNIVMTTMDIEPRNNELSKGHYLMSRHLGARPNTIKMDASKGICKFVYNDTGEIWEPCMMHFACNEAPVVYTWQLYLLFRKFNVSTKGLFSLGAQDFYELYIKPKIRNIANILGFKKRK
jgi:hypothetical protein